MKEKLPKELISILDRMRAGDRAAFHDWQESLYLKFTEGLTDQEFTKFIRGLNRYRRKYSEIKPENKHLIFAFMTLMVILKLFNEYKEHHESLVSETINAINRVDEEECFWKETVLGYVHYCRDKYEASRACLLRGINPKKGAPFETIYGFNLLGRITEKKARESKDIREQQKLFLEASRYYLKVIDNVHKDYVSRGAQVVHLYDEMIWLFIRKAKRSRIDAHEDGMRHWYTNYLMALRWYRLAHEACPSNRDWFPVVEKDRIYGRGPKEYYLITRREYISDKTRVLIREAEYALAPTLFSAFLRYVLEIYSSSRDTFLLEYNSLHVGYFSLEKLASENYGAIVHYILHDHLLTEAEKLDRMEEIYKEHKKEYGRREKKVWARDKELYARCLKGIADRYNRQGDELKAIKYYRIEKNFHTIPIIAGLHETISYLNHRGVTTAIVTTANQYYAEQFKMRFGFEYAFGTQ